MVDQVIREAKMEHNNVFFAPAKLNLFLHIIGKRRDGYHLIQTVFRMINLYDEISISIRTDGRIQRGQSPSLISPETDLVVRAAELLKQESGCSLGADIELKKIIPIGAGLGGGSSDAATTLMALNYLWGVRFSKSRLLQIAPKLGADVAFFIFGQSAFGEGIGEKLSHISLKPKFYLLIHSDLSVSTAEIFGEVELTPKRKAITIQRFLAGEATSNDFESLVCSRHLEVKTHLALLRKFGDAKITGTGGTVFCEFDSLEEAKGALLRLPDGILGSVVRGIDKHPMLEQRYFSGNKGIRE